jgi:hypothetical protein
VPADGTRLLVEPNENLGTFPLSSALMGANDPSVSRAYVMMAVL